MTGRADQVLVLGDDALADWLADRFGIDPGQVLTLNGFTISAKVGEPVVLHLQLLVGADDLAAFPKVQ